MEKTSDNSERFPIEVNVVDNRELLERLLPYLALLVSVFAISLSVWQARKTDYHNRLMVTPKMQALVSVKVDGDWTGLRVESRGLGPAIVSDMEIFLDGRPTTFPEIIDEHKHYFFKKEKVNWGSIGLPGGAFYPVGQARQLLVTAPANIITAHSNDWRELITQRVAVFAYVCSVFDECNQRACVSDAEACSIFENSAIAQLVN